MQILSDEYRKRSEQYPDCKAHVEIEEAGDKGREMTQFKKSAVHGGSQFSAAAHPDLSGCEPPLVRVNLVVTKATHH
jgi:hypothetical protein